MMCTVAGTQREFPEGWFAPLSLKMSQPASHAYQLQKTTKLENNKREGGGGTPEPVADNHTHRTPGQNNDRAPRIQPAKFMIGPRTTHTGGPWALFAPLVAPPLLRGWLGTASTQEGVHWKANLAHLPFHLKIDIITHGHTFF